MQFHSECGLELLLRLSRKAHLINLDDILFSTDIGTESIIEIVGPSSTGKTVLLCQFIAKFILPAQWEGIKINGCDGCAILIDTLSHVQISKIAELMSCMIHNAYQISGVQPAIEIINTIINKSLENLVVLNCCNNDQFQLTLRMLEDELFANEKITLLAIDNISAYYWQERREKGIFSMDSYVRDLLRVIQVYVSQFKNVMVYTRLKESMSENESCKQHANPLEKSGINYRLQLHKTNTIGEFMCNLKSMNNTKNIHYTICNSGIKWMSQ